VRYDGQYRWMLVSILRGEGDLLELQLQDIAEYQNALEDLKGNNDRYTEYFSLMESLMMSYDIDTDRLKIFMLGGHQQMNFYSGTLADWKSYKLESGAVDSKCISEFNKLCEDFQLGTMTFEHELNISLMHDGDRRQWCVIKGKTLSGMQQRSQVIATVSIISPISRGERSVSFLPDELDSGTNLLNKRAITNYAQRLIASKPNNTVTIAIIDIDDFKSVNDGFGHMFGDEVITKVANLIREAVDGKGISGRIGGDEMFIVLEGYSTVDSVRTVLRSIRSNVEWLYANDDSKPDITCSIGSATYPRDASDYKSLFEIADKMLYLAKEKGRNRYIIYQNDLHSNYINGKGDAKESDIFSYKYRKSSVVNEIVNQYCIRKDSTAEAVAEKIALTFGIDSIYLYEMNGANYHRYTLYGDDRTSACDGVYLYEDNYMTEFREDNTMVINNINSFERKTPTLFHAFTEMNINQAIQIDVKKDIRMHSIVSFNRTLRKRQWEDNEILYLSILGNILGMRFEH